MQADWIMKVGRGVMDLGHNIKLALGNDLASPMIRRYVSLAS